MTTIIVTGPVFPKPCLMLMMSPLLGAEISKQKCKLGFTKYGRIFSPFWRVDILYIFIYGFLHILQDDLSLCLMALNLMRLAFCMESLLFNLYVLSLGPKYHKIIFHITHILMTHSYTYRLLQVILALWMISCSDLWISEFGRWKTFHISIGQNYLSRSQLHFQNYTLN